MIATEMARIIDKEWHPDRESLEGFCTRRFAREKATTLVAALEIINEILTADEEFDEVQRAQNTKGIRS